MLKVIVFMLSIFWISSCINELDPEIKCSDKNTNKCLENYLCFEDKCQLKEDLCKKECGNVNCSPSTDKIECLCDNGFVFNKDEKRCKDINECLLNSHDCSEVCENTEGSFTCLCNEGFKLSEDNKSCEDIDECETNIDNCEQNCKNNIGNFTCLCNEGFTLNEDGFSCDDLDECALNKANCDINADCKNSIGSFECTCKSGYEGDGVELCSIIEICKPEYNSCTENNKSICKDEDNNGIAECLCNEGFKLDEDNITCIDINECENNSAECEQICNNTEASFNCSCEDGYQLNENGFSCDDINECLDENLFICSGINTLCSNTEGNYECICKAGFKLDTNNIDCIDIDECAINNGGCTQNCNNTEASFNCSCENGYSLNTDNRTCDDIDECSDSNLHSCEDNTVCSNTEGNYECICSPDTSLINGECRKLGIFVTAGNWNGDLGGGFGADTKCNEDSNKPDDGRYYKALVGILSQRDYNYLDWPLLASMAYFRANDKSVKIGVTSSDRRFNIEEGNLLINPFTSLRYEVWTGLSGICKISMYNNCDAWTRSTDNPNDPYDNTLKAYSDVINSNYDYQAISVGTTCDNTYHLYCIEQACPQGYVGDTCNECDYGYTLANGICTKNN